MSYKMVFSLVPIGFAFSEFMAITDLFLFNNSEINYTADTVFESERLLM